ncbi:MAG: flippase-like domain-containing protein [Bacteroidales bacterium]|nr:flippase-like domain-containing protein [Bacteroidales bacterium]
MKKKIIQAIKFVVFLAIGVGLLYYAAKGIDPKKVWENVKTAKYSWIILSLVIAIVSHLSRAQRWRLLIEPLGYKPSLKHTFYSVMIGYMANYAFPRIGEVTRCGMLNRSNKIPFDSLVGTVIVERATDLLFSMLFLVILLVSKFSFFGSFFGVHVFQPIGNKFSELFHNKLFIAIFASILVLIIIMIFVIKHRFKENPLVNKMKQIFKGVGSGLTSVYKMRRRWEYVLHSFLIWICYLMSSYVILYAFSFTSHLNLFDAVFILVAGSFGFIAPVQGGVGAFHFIVSRALMMYGISETDAFSFATIQHGTQSLLAILLGAVSFILIYKSLKINKASKHPTVNEAA